MSAVVLAQEGQDQHLTCVSLATGTKCLAASAMAKCKGLVLHDSHAEILALRGFNYWLLSEVQTILVDPAYRSSYLECHQGEPSATVSSIAESSQTRPFKLKDNISIHFFTTEAPCGDASMEILMQSFPSDAATPWAVNGDTAITLQGRGHFSLLGLVRRKPARADAEASLSKSCTDKLAVKQFTSSLSFPADLFIQRSPNAYINSIVVYAGQYHPAGYQRAFGPAGRLSNFSGSGHFFDIQPLPVDFSAFAFGREQPRPSGPSQAQSKASNISALWVQPTGTNRPEVVEALINGVKQGYKQWDERSTKASVVSRKALWDLGKKIGNSLEQCQSQEGSDSRKIRPETSWLKALKSTLSSNTYVKAKTSDLRRIYQERRSLVTDSLGNWTANTGDGDWSCSSPPLQSSLICR